MLKILIVDDEKPICDLIELKLSEAGYHCSSVQEGVEAIRMIERDTFDLVLLDIMLPEVDGYDIMKYIRPLGIPVIFVTAKHEVKDRVKGLRLGADDYLVKPFDTVELVARMEAVLRRYNKMQQHLQLGDVVVDIDAHKVTKGGRPIELTNKEFGLLVLFINNKNVALFREVLYEKVWQEDYYGDSRTLDLHVQRLRRKLNWDQPVSASAIDNQTPRLVAVYKIGYRLEVPQ